MQYASELLQKLTKPPKNQHQKQILSLLAQLSYTIFKFLPRYKKSIFLPKIGENMLKICYDEFFCKMQIYFII